MKRAAVAFFYDNDGIIDDYMIHLIFSINEYVDDTILVVNGFLNKASEALVSKYVKHIIIRENKGFDVAAYKQGLDYLNYDKLVEYDELILYNHTFYGPIFPFSEMFTEMDSRKCDLWGITSHKRVEPNPFTGDGILPHHFNSHFTVIRNSILKSQMFRKYWNELPEINSYTDSILLHEVRFLKYFEDLGYTGSVYVDSEKYTSNYPLFEEVDAVLKNRCPILKRRSLFSDPIMMDQMAIDLPRGLEVISRKTDYDTGLIWKNILREAELRTLHTNAALLKILPDIPMQTAKRSYGKIAACVHVYYVDMLEEILEYCNNIEQNFDLILTTDTQEKKKLILSTFEEYRKNKSINIDKFIMIVVEKNVGADTSALLISCKDLILNGGYDLVCRLHTKKSLQDTGGRGRYFKRHLFENLINSPGYVNNILDLFYENKSIGLMITPIIHTYYPTMGHAWFNNKGKAQKVSTAIGIKVKFDQNTPVAPFGGMFWFKPNALRKLFEYNWTWADFEEDASYCDGDLPHAIERLYAYVAQDAQYITQTIASLRQAEQSYVRLEYKTQKMASYMPQADFGYHIYLLSKWQEAGHPMASTSENIAITQFSSNISSDNKIISNSRYSVKPPTEYKKNMQRLVSFVVRKLAPYKTGKNISANIDSVNNILVVSNTDCHFKKERYKFLRISGWAADAINKTAFESVSIRLFSKNYDAVFPTIIVRRNDVAKHFDGKYLSFSGFECNCSMEEIKVGNHSIEIIGIDANNVQHKMVYTKTKITIC